MKRVFKIGGVLIVLALLLPEIVLPFVFTVAAVLLGWMPASVRLVQNCHPDFGTAFFFALAVAALIGGAHLFISWLVTNWRDDQGAPRLAGWRWRWTLCGFGIIVCSLLAVAALILTTHQIHWLAKSSEPFFADPFNERYAVERMAWGIKRDVDALNWSPFEVRKLMLTYYDVFPAEIAEPLILEKDDHAIQAIVLVARHPLIRDGAKLAVVRPGATNIFLPIEELPNVLASFEPRKAAAQ